MTRRQAATCRPSARQLPRSGLISAIGAYGGFLIPQALNLSQQATGSYTGAFFVFVLAYVALLVLTALVYGRTRSDGFRI